MELHLQGNVRVDIFGVTPYGRPVLVECKLWRNPGARREVVGQLLEYAGLLARWSYADLSSRLKSALNAASENPLYDHVLSSSVGDIEEADFVDAVSRNMRAGDFHLIIAGDGIHEGLHAVADLATQGARLALVEYQLWNDDTGRTASCTASAVSDHWWCGSV